MCSKIRSQFARSQWPDLRAAGMSYVDLVVKLQTARADGYETVWFHQRLSLACARHGWKQPTAEGSGTAPRGSFGLSRPVWGPVRLLLEAEQGEQ
jgi:hypothetical protein